VALRERGITELRWARLNARLALHGYVIHASKGRNPARLAACIGEDKGVEEFGLFESRRVEGETLRLKHSDKTVTSSMKAK
jgi:hypothetical protein